MASQEQNEAVAGLLRRGLAGGTTIGSCPSPDLLAAYFEHALDKNEASELDHHFSTCARCREQIAAMIRADSAEPESKASWLLDWRLLTAAAVMMLIVTVWLVRRPNQLSPVAENRNAPVAVPPKQTTESDYALKSTESSPTPASRVAGGALKQAMPALTAPAGAPSGPPSGGELKDEKKAVQGSLALDQQAGSAAGQQANNRALGIESDQVVTGAAPSAALVPPQRVRVGHAGASQQQQQQLQQQIPASSQMVMVEPGPASGPAPAAPSGSPQNARAPAKAANTANTSVPSSVAETVTVQAANENQPAMGAKDKQSSNAVGAGVAGGVVGGYVSNADQAQLQTLEERKTGKVIDTPIAAIKWRITPAGFVERSEDGGATWIGQEPDPEAHLISGSAPTDKVCWLVGKEGVVLVTKDAANWKKIPPPVSTDITDVSAKSASAATVTTADGRRFTTHNEGKKWKAVN